MIVPASGIYRRLAPCQTLSNVHLVFLKVQIIESPLLWCWREFILLLRGGLVDSLFGSNPVLVQKGSNIHFQDVRPLNNLGEYMNEMCKLVFACLARCCSHRDATCNRIRYPENFLNRILDRYKMFAVETKNRDVVWNRNRCRGRLLHRTLTICKFSG